MKKTLVVLIFLSLLAVNSIAQTFGFGCLGLSGFYGGYGIQNYDADGLNKSLALKYASSFENDKPIEFGHSTGFRFGANLLRAEFDNVFVTAKGFYQFAKESNSFNFNNNELTKLEYELTTNYWGFGIDFGLPVFRFLDIKLVEGGITFSNVELKEKSINGDVEVGDKTYNNDETKIGYYLGSGLIINIIKGYVSIEGSAIYHFYSVDQLNNGTGETFPIDSVQDSFIESGGFGAVVQLNIGFPL